MSSRLSLLFACALLGASAARADTQDVFEPAPAHHWYQLSDVRHFGLQLDG
jgi:hypothetical protein